MSEPILSRQERQARTRRQLLVAAAQIFASKGYHGATVSKIARRAGYTTGAVYGNFASKDGLFLALIDDHLEVQRNGLEQLLEEDDPAELRAQHRARIQGVVTALTRSSADDEPPATSGELTAIQLWTLTMEFLLYALRERPDLRPAISQRPRQLEGRLRGVVDHWLEVEGRDCALGPAEMALAHSLFIEGLALRLMQDPDLISPERAADLITTLLFELPCGGE
jgi:AcrR family transcriptional regulator